jgi:hypothetical protein
MRPPARRGIGAYAPEGMRKDKAEGKAGSREARKVRRWEDQNRFNSINSLIQSTR